MNYTILVNRENKLHKDFIPKDLVEVPTKIKGSVEVERKIYLNKIVAKRWRALKEYVKELGYEIDISSGYRSYEYQQKLLDKFIQNKGLEEALKIAALPGTSEHQTGLCFDYAKVYEEDEKIKTHLSEEDIEYGIVRNIAYKYGFIIRYPKGKESITGYKFEPWHLRYVGNLVAKEIYENNITLEEYKMKILTK